MTKAERPIKIIFDAQPLVAAQKSGVGYYTEGLVRALSKLPYLEVVGYYWRPRGGPVGEPGIPGVRFITSPWLSGVLYRGLRKLGLRLPLELFTKQTADIYLFPNFTLQPLLKSRPRVLTIHDMAFLDHPRFVQPKNRRFLSRFVRKDAAAAALILTVSKFTKSRIMDLYGLPGDKILVEPIPPPPVRSSESSIELPPRFILFIGNLEPRKNLTALVEGYSLLSSKLKAEYPLVLAGGGGWDNSGLTAKVKERQAKGDSIIMTGYVDEATRAALYRQAALIVMPSYYEGFGMPVLEAMSYAKPLLLSDIPVFKEVAGGAAAFMDGLDAESIKKSLGTLLDDSAKMKSLSMKSKEKATSYSWDKVASEIGQAFKRLA